MSAADDQGPVDAEAPEYAAARKDEVMDREAAKPAGEAKPGAKDEGSDTDDKGGDDKGGGDKGDAKDDAKGGDKPDDEPPPKPLKERPVLLIVIAVVLIALITGGVLYWLNARQYETTDDAYVDGHIVRIAPQVSGIVRQVLVDDNQVVGPNETLAIIDTVQPQARYQGLLAQAKQARATVAQSEAQVGVVTQQIAAARAQVIQPQADLDRAQADLARYRTLQRIEPAAVAGQQLDAAVQAVEDARGRRDAALKAVHQAEAQLKATKAQVGADRAAVTNAAAQARVTAADLANARVIAPIVGRVANRTIDPGSYVSPGTQMLAIVPLKLWVTANFKETQLALMRVGQPVTMRIDTVPDVEFRGHVESFQRGAGQAFALLPAENATGNFVKVVQRVPVRIAIDSPGIEAYPVGPGMSVVPRVKVR
jgi:membrane fusion protein (multidrug efflux system)